MSTFFIFLASLFVAGSNLCMRRSIDAGGSSKGFLCIQLFLTFVVAILLNPVRTSQYEWSGCMAAFGAAGGIILAGLMVSLGKALEKGPPGLTFAILNSSSVMPMILMALFFGAKFGFIYSLWHGVGSLIVLAGLFWAAKETLQKGSMAKWISFATAAFLFHVMFLVFMQWRALFINYPGENGLFLSFDTNDVVSQWFMPMIFLVATAVQFGIYGSTQKHLPKGREFFYGILGGCANGVGTFFLIRATELATPMEHAMLFPLYCVTILVLCNLWGQWLYKEKVNWLANGCCILGLLVGTLDWGVILK